MIRIIFILFLVIFIANQAFAITLVDALNQTYQNNTELNAERENINVSKEDLNITKGEYLPSASITGTKSQEDTNKLTNQSGGDATINDVDPLTTSIKLEQKLIDFGRSAEFKKKKIGLDLAEAKLLKTEQDILYKATEAFTGLIVANEMLKINGRNLKLLQRQVENDKVRLEIGKITVSDLAQSESSLAGAQAQFIQAENDVVTNKLNYENVIGKISDPNGLKKIIKSFCSYSEKLKKRN